MTRYWCPTCGIVRDLSERAICRHNLGATRGPAPRWMEPIPDRHPLARGPLWWERERRHDR